MKHSIVRLTCNLGLYNAGELFKIVELENNDLRLVSIKNPSGVTLPISTLKLFEPILRLVK